jgi:hypothetical protein
MKKKYIFITSEGEIITPNGKKVKNQQVIGIVGDVESEDEALKKLLKENHWIFDCEFNVAEFKTYEIL